jgi:hypothetical protein
MLQVATFLVPAEQDKANEFLKTHKPSQQGINFNKDTIVIFYENDPAADLVEQLENVQAARFSQELALHILKSQIADLNPSHNKGKYEELDGAIRNVQDAIANQDIKADFLNKNIAEKRAAK